MMKAIWMLTNETIVHQKIKSQKKSSCKLVVAYTCCKNPFKF